MLSWRKLNDILSGLSERQVFDMLQDEIETHKRVTVLERLHQRYTTLRAARERAEIMREAVK
jgi:hypothetical protein